jgi:hypothetical protein
MPDVHALSIVYTVASSIAVLRAPSNAGQIMNLENPFFARIVFAGGAHIRLMRLRASLGYEVRKTASSCSAQR